MGPPPFYERGRRSLSPDWRPGPPFAEARLPDDRLFPRPPFTRGPPIHWDNFPDDIRPSFPPRGPPHPELPCSMSSGSRRESRRRGRRDEDRPRDDVGLPREGPPRKRRPFAPPPPIMLDYGPPPDGYPPRMPPPHPHPHHPFDSYDDIGRDFRPPPRPYDWRPPPIRRYDDDLPFVDGPRDTGHPRYVRHRSLSPDNGPRKIPPWHESRGGQPWHGSSGAHPVRPMDLRFGLGEFGKGESEGGDRHCRSEQPVSSSSPLTTTVSPPSVAVAPSPAVPAIVQPPQPLGAAAGMPLAAPQQQHQQPGVATVGAPDAAKLIEELSMLPPEYLSSSTCAYAHDWQYVDLQGQQQGPFTSLDMLRWSVQGYFKPDTALKRNDESRFSPLADGRLTAYPCRRMC